MDTKKNLCNVNFYLNNDVCKSLRDKAGDNEQQLLLKLGNNDKYSFDIIDQPFHCELRAEGEDIAFFIHIRSDFGIYQDAMANLHVLFHKNGDKPTIISQNGIGGDVNQTVIYYLKVAVQLRDQISDSFYEKISDIDIEKEGVLVRLIDNEIEFKIVSGKKRPSMLCHSLFQGMHMARPYQDESIDALLSETMSFEDKLQAAEDGDENAMGEVAIAYLNGNADENISPDSKKAFYWFKKQAELDNSTGQFNLAVLYLKGEGVEQSFEEALHWMKKAEENGDPDASAHVSTYEKIVNLKKKADENDPHAMAELAGELMSLGSKVGEKAESKFYKMSVDLAEKSKEGNCPDAYWILALAYDHGRGVSKDSNKALEYYQKGAELGNAACLQNIGVMYIYGDNVPEDKKKGFNLCMKAAEQGNALSMKTVGTCYQYGYGVQESMKNAIYWYEKTLEVMDDPELAQKVMIFKTLPDIDGDSIESDDDYKKVDPSIFAKDLVKIDFKDKLFVLTGFDIQEEDKLKSIITDRGGVVKSSTVLKTDYLVVKGDYSSKKYERAVELNQNGKSIAIISKEQFYRILDAEKNAPLVNEKENSRQVKKETDKTATKSKKEAETKSKNTTVSKPKSNNSKRKKLDDYLSFDFPKGYSLVKEKDEDGKQKYEIKYNLTSDKNGNKNAEKSYSILCYLKGKSLEGNFESNFNVYIGGFNTDFSVGLNVSSDSFRRSHEIKYKAYSCLAIIDYGAKWYTINSVYVGLDDYESRSNAASELSEALTTVLGFVYIDGERLKIKPISKTFLLDQLKNETVDLPVMPLTPEEEAAVSEYKKKEEEEKKEKERLEKEARKKALEEKRKAEAERKKKAEEEAKRKKQQRIKQEEAIKSAKARLSEILPIYFDYCIEITEDKYNKLIDDEKEKIDSANNIIKSLGLFKFGEKRAENDKIKRSESKIYRYENKKAEIISLNDSRKAKTTSIASEMSKGVFENPPSPIKKACSSLLEKNNDKEFIADNMKMIADYYLKSWRNDNHKKWASLSDDKNISTNTVEIRMYILQFYLQHEGQNIYTAPEYLPQNLKTQRGDEPSHLTIDLHKDLEGNGFLSPRYRSKEGIVTNALSNKGLMILADYLTFFQDME